MEVEEDYKCAYLIFCSEKYIDILVHSQRNRIKIAWVSTLKCISNRHAQKLFECVVVRPFFISQALSCYLLPNDC